MSISKCLIVVMIIVLGYLGVMSHLRQLDLLLHDVVYSSWAQGPYVLSTVFSLFPDVSYTKCNVLDLNIIDECKLRIPQMCPYVLSG